MECHLTDYQLINMNLRRVICPKNAATWHEFNTQYEFKWVSCWKWVFHPVFSSKKGKLIHYRIHHTSFLSEDKFSIHPKWFSTSDKNSDTAAVENIEDPTVKASYDIRINLNLFVSVLELHIHATLSMAMSACFHNYQYSVAPMGSQI